MLHRLAYGTLLASFPGTETPPWVRDALADGLGGVTLFGFNIESADGLRSLTASLGDVIIALDEEGGDVTRLDHRVGSRYPGNAALGAVDDAELTEAVYRSIGANLARAGVNLDMAPNADVNTADGNPVIGTRSFGNRADLVARHTVAAVGGLQAAGVAACVKHFPGHGATLQDSHYELATVDISPSLLRSRELVPFRAAIEAGTKSIMTAHVRVPSVTGDAPATLSPTALTGLLREELGYRGVVITDAMDMKAISAGVGIARGAVLTLIAGADLLCLGPQPGPDDIVAVHAAIVAAVESGELPLSRLEESAERVAALRSWLGTAERSAAQPDEIGLTAARRAVRVVSQDHADGTAQPYGTDREPVGTPGEPLVLQLAGPSTIAVGRVPWGLPGAAITDPGVDAGPLLDSAAGRPLILVMRDAHRFPQIRDLASKLLAARPDATVVEMGLPIWRPACGAYVATYGAARVNAQAAAELLGLS